MPARLSWTAASKSGTTVTGYQPRKGGVNLGSALGSGVTTYLDASATTGSTYDVVATFADGTTIASAPQTYAGASGFGSSFGSSFGGS